MSPTDNREPMRHVRVHDDLWQAALDAAAWRGETVSEVIRRGLRQYVAGTVRRREAARNGTPVMPTRRAVVESFPPAPTNGRGRMRHVRVSEELWRATLAAVKWRGDPSASHIIRRALSQYVAGTERRRKEAGER